MNILPHKSWHVRTKKNIARVRKDEAQAAEEEKERQRKIALAGQEARTALLRQRASERLTSASEAAPIATSTEDRSITLAPVNDIVQSDGHVNFFVDVEEGRRQGGVNKEAEAEKKQEQEDYEKKIGYLVYLGQDSHESSKTRPWYANIERGTASEPKVKETFEKIKNFENSGFLQGTTSKNCDLTPDELKLAKFKSFQDPLSDIRKYLKTPGVAQKLEQINKKTKALKRKRSPSPPPTSSHSKKSKKHKTDKSKKKSSKKSKHKSHHKDKKHKRKHSSSSTKLKSSSSSSSGEEETSEDEIKRINLEKLRAERLQREREERRRTEQLMAKLRGEKPPEELEKEKAAIAEAERDGGFTTGTRVKQKYNSQFNPDLARQNY